VPKYDVPERYDVIKRGLIKLGLEYRHASKHDVATCPTTGNKTTVPRHKTRTLKKYTVGEICQFLIANGYTEAEVKKAFKWK
jgi:hypothetical protein